MIKKDTCEIYYYDEEKVNRIQGNLQTVDISSVAQMLKAIADKNRAKITYALCQDDKRLSLQVPMTVMQQRLSAGCMFIRI